MALACVEWLQGLCSGRTVSAEARDGLGGRRLWAIEGVKKRIPDAAAQRGGGAREVFEGRALLWAQEAAFEWDTGLTA